MLVQDALYAVADGMGGHNGGKEASENVLSSIAQTLKDAEPSREQLLRAVETANAHVCAMQEADTSLSGMGTTLSLLWRKGDTLLAAHIGDSRIYLMRGGLLRQVSCDHSLVAEMIQNGLITHAEAETHPYRNVITRALGSQKQCEPDILMLPLHPEDRWLICSDGLHGAVGRETIESAMGMQTPEKAADKLLEAALDSGGKDNISLVVLFSDEGVTL